jgi:hypothetical protein
MTDEKEDTRPDDAGAVPMAKIGALVVPVSTVERCAALVRWVARKPAYAPSGYISKAGVVRLALAKGLEVLEREAERDAAAKAKAAKAKGKA